MGKHKGFTLIEVTLFMGVTAALFIGIALAMRNSLFQQRANDSLQTFYEFMRSIYSEVSNTQSGGAGNSTQYAIYGKLIVFGENCDIICNNNTRITGNDRPIFTYDVVGAVNSTGSGDVSALLKSLGANVMFVTKSDNNVTGATLASPEKFEPSWGTVIENPDHSEVKKSILVVRHPRSGTINTLVYNGTLNVNERVRTINNTIQTFLTDHLGGTNGFKAEEVNLCVNPYGLNSTGAIPRRNIRIQKNARNASGVEMVELDATGAEGNKCL